MWKKRELRKKSSWGKRYMKILPIVFIPLVLILILSFIFKAGLFNIKEIEIVSDEAGCADNNQLKDASKLLGQNFFALDKNRLAKNLKGKFICVKDINLSRAFPNRVKVTVIGRQPVAMLVNLKEKLASPSSLIENTATPSAEEITGAFVVDSEGVLFDKGNDDQNIQKIFIYNLDLPLGEKLKNDFFINCLKILDKIKTYGIIVKDSFISEGENLFADSSFFIVNTESPGPKIIFQLNDQIDIQLASLQLILDKAKIDSGKLEFIDLRFDKPIVRFAPKK